MAISITGPDGSTFDFPDGTEHAVIIGAMQKHYGQPKIDSLGAAGGKAANASEPREVTAIREQFRSQGPVKIAAGNLMGLSDEINSAGAAGIDRLVGRTDDWNERRKAYRKAFKEERAAAEHQLGGVGTFAADFVGGMAATPFKMASQFAPAVSALPLPMMGAMKPALPAAGSVSQAVVRPFVETARNLPTLAKTGALYGGISGFIGSPEDDAASRTVQAGYGAVGGAAMMPGIHFGANALASAAQGAAGTVRAGFEKLTGTTPQQRAVMAANKQELLDAGMREREIYGPFLRPEGEGWAAKGIANSMAGHQVSKKAADRHIAGLEREMGQALDATGAPRAKFTAGNERQEFLDRQLNRYSMPKEVIENLDDATRSAMAAPLETGLPPRPSPRVEPDAQSRPAAAHPHERYSPGLNSVQMYSETGPLAANAPAFLKRPTGSLGRALQERQGNDFPARSPGTVGPRGRGLDGETLPPEPQQTPGLPPPEQAPPSSQSIPYDPSLTYKDRVAAMYENLHRDIPGQAKGGMGTAKRPHTQDIETNKVIEAIREQARAERRLPGDDRNVSWWESPARDLIEKEVRRHLPGDFVTSLFAQDGNHPAVRQIMRYRTEVRDADTSNPMSRTTTQTWLPRMEEALTKDRNARLSYIDSESGKQSLARAQNADRQYAALKEHHVAPLKSILGENVRPEQAMDRLASALKGKDLTMIRAYSKAHRAARQETEGAGAVVAHLMEDGIGNFVKEFSSYTAPAKAALFVGEAKPLGAALERYVKLAGPAIEARDAMTWHRGGVQNLAVGTAYVLHNMTSAITLALGQYGAARFIASPRYVNWMTRAAPVVSRQPNAWQGQLEALALMASGDKSELGRNIVKQLSDAEKKRRLSAADLNRKPEASP